jgi:PAS domain S-box-containing protein
MNKIVVFFLCFLPSVEVLAGITDIFKDENGKTRWQILANWSSGTLIILLTIVVVSLYFARKRAFKANHALNEIKKNLEQRVKERTANLDTANVMLKESNDLLESEIENHIETSARLKQSESYISDILKSMPLMLIGLNKEGLITHWNQRTAEVSGIAAKDAIGKSLWEAYPTATVSPENIKQAIEGGKPVHLKQSLRSLSHFDVLIYPLTEQKEPGVVILVDDVTRQTQAENMLIHNDKMSFMGELASTMAHDINVPLQGMLLDLRSFQRVLSEHNEDASLEDSAAKAKRINAIIGNMTAKGEQVSTIIGNLLTFARNRKEEKQIVNMSEVLENTLRLSNDLIEVAPDFAFRDITIERHFDLELPPVACYVTEMQQVFLSLFRTASTALYKKHKSQPEFTPVIKLLLTECYDSLWIKVQHNGVGLTSEEQMSLFEPYFSQTADKHATDAGERLSFVYYIVTEQHAGQMAVTSNVDIGSTFHIQLPL